MEISKKLFNCNKDAKRLLSRLIKLRNSLAHAYEDFFIGFDLDEGIQLVQNIEGLLINCEQLLEEDKIDVQTRG